MDTKTKHQTDAEAALVPGVDYDVLTPEEHAAELRQPDPAVAENDAHVLATGGQLPVDSGETLSVSSKESRQTLKHLARRLEGAKSFADLKG